jgi:hypothetical protein
MSMVEKNGVSQTAEGDRSGLRNEAPASLSNNTHE